MDRGRHQHGKDFLGHDRFSYRWNKIVDGNRAFAEKLFHHFVVAFGNHFDQLFVGFFGLVGKRSGNFFNGWFAVAIGFVDVCFHGHQIDNAAESFFAADRQLQ